MNVKQRSVQQSIIAAHELPYEILRIHFLSLTIVAVDINVETLKFCCHNLLKML